MLQDAMTNEEDTTQNIKMMYERKEDGWYFVGAVKSED